MQNATPLRIKESRRVLASSDDGVVIIIFALVVVLVLMAVSVALNIGYSKVVKTDMRVAADAAAISGAGALCSSQTCWRNARLVALAALSEHTIRGSLNHSSRVDFSGQESNETPRWDFGAIRVTVERGRWHPEDGEFESMEEPTADDWQLAHPGIPNFIGANAVRVMIERPAVSMFFNPFRGLSDLSYEMVVEAVAAGGRQDDVCVAPFAIPVCSLVNESGDFDASMSCHFDRYITEADRYCPSGEDCDVVPGAFWNPAPIDPTDFPQMSMASAGAWGVEGCPPFYWSTDGKDAWYCPLADNPNWEPSYVGYQLQSMMTGGGAFGQALDNKQQEWRSLRKYMTQMPTLFLRGSRFNVPLLSESEITPGQRRGRAGDHYGVFGLPIVPGATSATISEESIRDVVSSLPPCQTARLGQKFRVLGDGLIDPESEQVIWDQITNNLGGSADQHPRMIDTELGWPAVTFKHQLINVHWGIREEFPFDIQVSRAYAYNEAKAYGACNSRRWGYRGMRGEDPGRAWTDIPSDPNDYHYTPFRNRAENTYEQLCESDIDFMFGYYEDVFVSQDLDADGKALDETGRVWRVSVPVISESCGDASVASCAGINGATDDPLIDSSKEYEICAFIEVYVMDVDIGYEPPLYPRAECPTAHESHAHYPWGFDLAAQTSGPDTVEPTACNNARTRHVCDARLLASSEHTGAPTPSLVR